MKYRIEFLNPSTNSWLSGDCDFAGCSAGFDTKTDAQDWIDATQEDESFCDIDFRVIES
jgi:hypothetical protein